MQHSKKPLVAVQAGQAESYAAHDRLVEAGIPRPRIRILPPDDAARSPALKAPRTREKAVIGAMLGLVGGAAFGGLVCLGLWAFGVFAYVAIPWLLGLLIVGYTAGAGAVTGGLIGWAIGKRPQIERARDAAAHGRWVVLVDVHDAEERARAQAALAEEPPSLPRAA